MPVRYSKNVVGNATLRRHWLSKSLDAKNRKASTLKSILPKEEICSKFNLPISFEGYGFDQINIIAELEPATMNTIGLSIWNRIIYYNRFSVDPMALKKDVDKMNPKIHMRIANIVKRRVINDICYIHGRIEDETLEYRTVAEMFVANVYPEELHLADIEFSNPYAPIPKEEKKFEHQNFAGLGLLDQFMENLENYANTKSCKYLTLTATTKEHVDLFSKYGFVVENSIVGKMGMANGIGIPMEKKL